MKAMPEVSGLWQDGRSPWGWGVLEEPGVPKGQGLRIWPGKRLNPPAQGSGGREEMKRPLGVRQGFPES